MDAQLILQRGSGSLRDCLREGRVPKLAGLPTPWVKEVFKAHRFFILDKFILNKKVHPMTSFPFHQYVKLKL